MHRTLSWKPFQPKLRQPFPLPRTSGYLPVRSPGTRHIQDVRLLVVRAFFVLLERILQYPVLFPWYVLTLSLHFRRSAFDRLMVVNGGYPASLLCRAAVIAWVLSAHSAHRCIGQLL